MAKLIHTADIHLGAPLGWLGTSAERQRDQLRTTLTRIVDLAATERADCLLIAGDLFDSQSPPASDVRHAIQEFERLRAASGTPVVILPGSHDYLGPASVYSTHRKDFARHGSVSILGLDGRPSVDLHAVGLSIRGAAPMSNRSSAHQLAGLVPDPSFQHNVVVGHGSLTTAPVAADDHPIAPNEFAGWSYVALGHWHSWRDVSSGGTTAIYPGAPEVIAVDQTGAGHVAVVTIDENGTEAKRHRVGQRVISEVDVDLTGVTELSSIASRVRSEVPPDADTILRLSFSGLLSVGLGIDPEELRELLSGDYFYVATGSRSYHLRLDETELEALPERLVVGRFARLMKQRLDSAASEAEREEAEDALQMGVALLHGRDVLG